MSIDFAHGSKDEKDVWGAEIWERAKALAPLSYRDGADIGRDYDMTRDGVINIIARYALKNF